MQKKRDQEEHLEKLWYMKEENKNEISDLRNLMEKDFNLDIVNELSSQNLISLSDNNTKVKLTKEGADNARQLIRAHRIAERMLHDVIGGDFETGACEFEHTVNPELVDSICTLLGHPKECPHGLPIPQGECCKTMKRTAESSVVSLKDLKVGQSAKVAFVSTKNDQQLHKIDGLHIRPGAEVKLHQVYPTYVIECEGVNIALDEEVTSNISVWKKAGQSIYADDSNNNESPTKNGMKKNIFDFAFGRKNRK